MSEYLSRLNPEQRDAVESVDGPLLVLAGAGTGKTRVLTTRFAHILLSGRAAPGQVLAVTFTNKAAKEMRERVGAILGRPVEGLWLGTFHALCARMLRRHAEHVGLTANFSILDTDDQMRLLKQVMEAARVDTKRWLPQALMGMIQRWKDRGLTPDRITPAEEGDFAGGNARMLYTAYQTRLRELNATDFGDLMLHVTEIFRTHHDVLASITACSATCWWTNTRIPTWCSICGCACSLSNPRTSAASVTTTRASIPGAAPRWKTSCASNAIFRVPRSSSSKPITAAPRRSSVPPPA